MKYCPQYPDRLESYEHGLDFCYEFLPWYNEEHPHSGLAYFTSSDVHHGRVPEKLARGQAIMNKSFERTPECFPGGAPIVPAPPKLSGLTHRKPSRNRTRPTLNSFLNRLIFVDMYRLLLGHLCPTNSIVAPC